MDLLQLRAPFDDPDFLYEVKFDGFRALAYVEDGHCELVSRKGHTNASVKQAAAGLDAAVLLCRAEPQRIRHVS